MSIDLCTLSDVKAYNKITDTSNDTVLSRLITAASEEIRQFTGREFVTEDSPDTMRAFDIDVWGRGRDIIEVTDLTAQPSLVEIYAPNGSLIKAMDNSNVICLPRPRRANEPITFLQLRFVALPRFRQYLSGHVEVTGTWGWPSVPTDVVQAAILTVSEWNNTDVSKRSATLEENGGQSQQSAPGPLPPRVMASLLKYRRYV